MRILVVNAGSSSLKLRLVGPGDALLADHDVAVDPRAGTGPVEAAIVELAGRCGRVDAVGHRVVHGGPRRHEAVVVDAGVVGDLEEAVPLAPLHQPAALRGIAAAAAALPSVPAVACFDTAFHAALPDEAATYPVPAAWRARHGLRRLGFHGLSHAWAVRRSGELLGGVPDRLVTCHLGAGSSVSAVVGGRPVDTTMGFTPNEGVPMATRSGSVDVGMLTWLLGQGVPAGELEDGLQHGGGLRALAGTGDMREVEAAAGAGEPGAVLALGVWTRRVAQAVASMATSAGGLDALVFTGGIGEHAPARRAAVVDRLAWLGLALDPGANGSGAGGSGGGSGARGSGAGGGDRDVATASSRARVLVVAAREDLTIAAEVRSVLGGSAGAGRGR
jgi:acetate kinase